MQLFNLSDDDALDNALRKSCLRNLKPDFKTQTSDTTPQTDLRLRDLGHNTEKNQDLTKLNAGKKCTTHVEGRRDRGIQVSKDVPGKGEEGGGAVHHMEQVGTSGFFFFCCAGRHARYGSLSLRCLRNVTPVASSEALEHFGYGICPVKFEMTLDSFEVRPRLDTQVQFSLRLCHQ